jgi:hypothetical protein
MAAPTPDPGIASLAATMPCWTRRWLGPQDTTTFAAYGFFPWKGQNIDTPVGKVGAKWTTDDDTHPIP